MCQVGQLRVKLVKLHVNYAKRENQSLLKSHPANIFPMRIYCSQSLCTVLVLLYTLGGPCLPTRSVLYICLTKPGGLGYSSRISIL